MFRICVVVNSEAAGYYLVIVPEVQAYYDEQASATHGREWKMHIELLSENLGEESV